MADAVTVTLGKTGAKARAMIENGRYATMSEVVREGILALEREQDVLNAFYRRLIDEAQNDPRPYVDLNEAIERVLSAPFPTA